MNKMKEFCSSIFGLLDYYDKFAFITLLSAFVLFFIWQITGLFVFNVLTLILAGFTMGYLLVRPLLGK